MDKKDLEEKNVLIERAKIEAENISKDIDFVIEKIKTKEYDLLMAKEEFSWRIEDMEKFYFNNEHTEVNEIYQEVLDKVKAALKRVEDKIQEEGLDKL